MRRRVGPWIRFAAMRDRIRRPTLTRRNFDPIKDSEAFFKKARIAPNEPARTEWIAGQLPKGLKGGRVWRIPGGIWYKPNR